MRASPRPAHPHPHRPVLRVDAPAGAFFSEKTPSYIFECIQVLCCGWTLPQGLFVFFINTFLYVSPVLLMDAPAGAFCFLQKHLLILFVCIQVLCYGRTVPMLVCLRVCFVLFVLWCFDCIQILCYRWTLLQGLVVFFTNTFLYS